MSAAVPIADGSSPRSGNTARRGRDRYPSLIAHTPRTDGWWRHAIRIEHDRDRLTLAMVSGQRDGGRDDLLAADYVTVLRQGGSGEK